MLSEVKIRRNLMPFLSNRDYGFRGALIKLARQPETSPTTLDLLLSMDNPDPAVIVAIYRARPERRRQIIESGLWRNDLLWHLRSAMMSLHDTPKGVIEELYESGEDNMLLGRVNRADCPKEILEHFASQKRIRNPDTPKEIVAEQLRVRSAQKLGRPIYPDE